MTFDLHALLDERRGDKFALFERHLNPQMLRVLRTLGFDVDYVHAEGPYLFDREDRPYLDLLSGFGVFALGRNHPTVIGALEQVLRSRLPGLVQLDVSLLAGILAERLLARMPWLDKAFFCNSGAEAVEAAIKFSRAATGRSKLLYCEHGFHGLTYGALSLCGDEPFRERFGPFVGECATVPFNDLPALERALATRDVAAFVVEPVQGKGVNLPADGYLAEAARLCRRHGTLLVADEIQCGMGRTGRFLACEHFGVEPDMVLLAKALSGGFVPVGAVLMRGAIFDRVYNRMERAFVHGSTFSKNDLAMAAGLATLAAFDEERLIERAAAVGEQLISGLSARLSGSELVKEVRGKGMMIAIELGPPRDFKLKAAYSLVERADKGLFCQLILIPLLTQHRILAQVAGHAMPVIKLLPPFVISDDDRLWIENAFAQVVGDSQSLAGMWNLGRTLAGHALRERAGSA
ncbi:MAG: aminotransferase class III-fold pyridoxal phosphate-dependent enzyme [Nitrococcus sp.]|nr:aminotransferase class III-fold pyridoxal phosphate-dependent enzyme [Nitrococcus sp.]